MVASAAYAGERTDMLAIVETAMTIVIAENNLFLVGFFIVFPINSLFVC